MPSSALRAGNACPYECFRSSGDERRGDHWSPDKGSLYTRELSAKLTEGLFVEITIDNLSASLRSVPPLSEAAFQRPDSADPQEIHRKR